MRRIIQIASTENGAVYALCDDNTIWYCIGDDWKQLVNIPQDKPHENKIHFEKINPERKD
jgi:hypothetical protein